MICSPSFDKVSSLIAKYNRALLTSQSRDVNAKYKEVLKMLKSRKKITSGGYGEVYMCYNNLIGKASIEELDITLAVESLLQYFASRECNNIVPQISTIRYGKFMLITPYMNQGDLFDFVDKFELSFEAKIDITRQMTRACLCLNQHSIIHRDLKLDNFLVSEVNGKIRVYLSDLGLSHWQQNYTVDFGHSMPRQFNTPENYKKNIVDSRSTDTYNLALIIFELFAFDYGLDINYNSKSDKLNPRSKKVRIYQQLIRKYKRDYTNSGEVDNFLKPIIDNCIIADYKDRWSMLQLAKYLKVADKVKYQLPEVSKVKIKDLRKYYDDAFKFCLVNAENDQLYGVFICMSIYYSMLRQLYKTKWIKKQSNKTLINYLLITIAMGLCDNYQTTDVQDFKILKRYPKDQIKRYYFRLIIVLQPIFPVDTLYFQLLGKKFLSETTDFGERVNRKLSIALDLMAEPDLTMKSLTEIKTMINKLMTGDYTSKYEMMFDKEAYSVDQGFISDRL